MDAIRESRTLRPPLGLRRERALRRAGHRVIAGLDELRLQRLDAVEILLDPADFLPLLLRQVGGGGCRLSGGGGCQRGQGEAGGKHEGAEHGFHAPNMLIGCDRKRANPPFSAPAEFLDAFY